MREIPLLRGFLVTMTVLVIGAVLAYQLAPREQLRDWLIVVLLAEPVAAFLGTTYQWWIWFRGKHRPRSWLLFYFAFLSTLVSVGLLVPAYFSIRDRIGRPLGLGPVESEIVQAFGIGLIGAAPIALAILFWHVRRHRGSGAPPPFAEGD